MKRHIIAFIMTVAILLALAVPALAIPVDGSEPDYLVAGETIENSGSTETETSAESEHNGYIIKLKNSIFNNFINQIVSSLVRKGVLEPVPYVEDAYVVKKIEDISQFVNSDFVDYIEPNYLVELYDYEPDTYYIKDGSILQQNYQWYLDAIKYPYARDNEIIGNGVRVGIIDTGVNKNHEDFSSASIDTGTVIITEPVNDTDAGADTESDHSSEEDSAFNDTVGHGTIVAGIIAAQTGNGKGIAGVAPGVTIVPIKCFSSKNAYVSDLASAINYAVENDCQVINMSFGMSEDSELMRNAVAAAVDAGITLVAAAGNDGSTLASYPASYEGVISVGSTDRLNFKSSFSNYNRMVDLMAPGEEIISLSNTETDTYVTDKQGTSFSAPIVTAACALLLSVNSSLTPSEIASILEDTASDRGIMGKDILYGAGIVNLEKALKKAEPKFEDDATDSISVEKADAEIQFKVNLYGKAPGSTVRIVSVENTPRGLPLRTKVFRCVVDADGTLEYSGSMKLISKRDGAKVYVVDSKLKTICEDVCS